MPPTSVPTPPPTPASTSARRRLARRSARRVGAAVVTLAVALTATACVGRLGRNDDDVTPQSDHPSANHAPRLDVGDPLAGRTP